MQATTDSEKNKEQNQTNKQDRRAVSFVVACDYSTFKKRYNSSFKKRSISL